MADSADLSPTRGHGNRARSLPGPRGAAALAEALVLVAAAIAGVAGPSRAQGGPPVVTSMEPRGGLRGTDLTLTLKGERLAETLRLVSYEAGIETLETKIADAKTVVFVLRLHRHAPLGEHRFRLHTKGGLSGLLPFRVGLLREIVEVEPNGRPGQETPVELGTTTSGRLARGDRDLFALDCVPDQEVMLEVEGVRLGGTPIDPCLVVRDPDGGVVAAAEDSLLGRADPWLSFRAKRAGRHVIEVRDTAFGGGDGAAYRLHVGVFPRPTIALPAGGAPGQRVELHYPGTSLLPNTITIPPGSFGFLSHFPSAESGVAPTPLELAIFDAPNALEDAVPDEGLAVPVALNGVVAAPKSEDTWRLRLEKNVEVEIAVLARTLRSPLDAVIALRGGKDAKDLVVVDDTGGSPDPKTTFRPPETGVYTLAISDQLRRGGPDFAYRIQIGRPSRTPVARVVTPKREDRTTIAVPRGGRMGLILQIDGPLGERPRDLGFAALPPGTRGIAAEFVPRKSPQLPIMIEAAADAPLLAGLATFDLGVQDAEREPVHFRQAVPLVRVDNDDAYVTTELRELAIAVVERLPFRIEVDAPRVPIVRGSELALRVRIERDAGFTKPVRVRPLWNPPSLTGNEIIVPGDRSDAVFPVVAQAAAPEARWAFALVATADLDGDVSTASGLVDIEVSAAHFALKPERVWTTPGARAELTVKVEQRRAFAGRVRPEILNLPKGVSAAVPEIDATTESFAVALTIAEDAPPVRMKDLIFRCGVTTEHGETVESFRGGELRIDAATGGGDPPPKGATRASGTVERPKT